MINFKFILLAYLFGPVVAVPYGLTSLHLLPWELFLYLSFLYLLSLPFLFKILELGGHTKIYQGRIIEKICQTCGIKAEKEVKKVEKSGNELLQYFQNKIGHLGFYLAISIFTFLFGVFLAALFSYLLKIKRKRAFLAISGGIFLGNFFWISVIYYSLPMMKLEFIFILLSIYLLLYGRKREIDIIKKIGKKFKLNKD